MKKSILLFLLISSLAVFAGCGNSKNDTANKNTTDNGNNATDKIEENLDKAGDAVKDGAKDAGDAVKNGARDVGDAVTYTAVALKDDVVKAGYDIKDSADTVKDYFKGKETDYYAGNDLIRVYEYDNENDLNADIATISSDGTIVNGTAIYDTKPHYYKKGNTLIIYEGNDTGYINEFNTLYGAPIMP